MKIAFDILETTDGYAVNPLDKFTADQCLVLAAYLKCVLDESYGKDSSEAIEYLVEAFSRTEVLQ